MRRLFAGAAFVALVFAPAMTQAAVTYSFVGGQTLDLGPVDPENPDGDRISVPVSTTFTLIMPDFITNGTFTPASCSSDNSNFSCGDMEFNNVPNDFNVGGDFLSFGYSYEDENNAFGGGAFYFFQPGAFAAAGVYTTDGWPLNGPPIGPQDSDYACCYGNAGFATLTVSGSPDSVVPEPATWALLITGFGGAGAMLRRRRARDAFVAA